MSGLTQVPVGVLPPERFEESVGVERFAPFAQRMKEAARLLEGRAVWNVNSTAAGGGVAEMLRSLLAYARGEGVDARWIVIPGNEDFFRLTKRLHNHLHGSPGDGGGLGADEVALYERTLAPSAEELCDLVRPGDIVIVHDPQPAGLCAGLATAGAAVIWRCHVGLDHPNEIARTAWEFLRGYVEPAHAYVFSRRAFAWERLADDRIVLIAPSIDAFSPKNQELVPEAVAAILDTSGIVPDGGAVLGAFTREDGAPGRVDRHAEMFEDEPVPSDAPVVTQVSRWDRLKDPVGVIEGFGRYVAPLTDAHLVVAGPSVAAVADDPEGAEVLAESQAARRSLPQPARARVHLAALPMEDREENAAIVNALQRRAAVVVQKSIAEGFGLTVAEGMWKARAVVATRIGGIQDQIEHGVSGILVDDPADLRAYGAAVRGLLEDEPRARRMGAEAQKRVRDEFLGVRHLLQYAELIEKLVGRA
ncbi:MAG: glycosyltransferase [Actinomycetota bacterium]|nr:glycosyltransferase [Actinomycetota bacterium]